MLKLTIRAVALLTSIFLLSSCQISYVLKSAYHQAGLLHQKVPISEVLKDPKISEKERQKLLLTEDVRQFAIQELGLKNSENYTSFVQLKRPFVSYVVSGAPKWDLTHYQWHFPVVGRMPYKGFFSEEEAKEEERQLKEMDLDTYVRGVRAYSTLGWFKDPVLSSMLEMKEPDFVNTLIHELVHTTLFVRNSVDFNEQIATYLGNVGTELFYLKKEGPQSQTVMSIQADNHDDRLFSEFISKEIESLKEWYKSSEAKNKDESLRKKRLHEIQLRFQKDLAPQLKTKNYEKFPELNLNNARLLSYKTYFQDHADFEKLFQLSGRDPKKFIQLSRQLEDSKNPNEALKQLVNSSKAP